MCFVGWDATQVWSASAMQTLPGVCNCLLEVVQFPMRVLYKGTTDLVMFDSEKGYNLINCNDSNVNSLESCIFVSTLHYDCWFWHFGFWGWIGSDQYCLPQHSPWFVEKCSENILNVAECFSSMNLWLNLARFIWKSRAWIWFPAQRCDMKCIKSQWFSGIFRDHLQWEFLLVSHPTSFPYHLVYRNP